MNPEKDQRTPPPGQAENRSRPACSLCALGEQIESVAESVANVPAAREQLEHLTTTNQTLAAEVHRLGEEAEIRRFHQPLARDIDVVIRTLRTFRERIRDPECGDVELPEVQRLLQGVELSLRNLLGHFGIEPMRSPGETFDRIRQRIVGQYRASDPVEVGQVVRRVAHGWRLGERTLVHERVEVYAARREAV